MVVKKIEINIQSSRDQKNIVGWVNGVLKFVSAAVENRNVERKKGHVSRETLLSNHNG